MGLENIPLEIWVYSGAILVLLGFSGFFSGSETALTAASKARIHSLARKGNKRAVIVKQLQEQKERMIGALLLGNNLVNILASVLMTSVMMALFGKTGMVYATFVMTALVLIFAEVLPKTYALNYSDKFALTVSPIIKILVFILAPITDAVAQIVKATLGIFGVKLGVTDSDENNDELRGAIDLHANRKNQNSCPNETMAESAMLSSILDLADVEVAEIMVHRKNIMMINADQDTDSLIDEVLSSPYTRLPVWHDKPDNVIGILHTKMLLRELKRCGSNTDEFNLKACMFDPWFIPESTTLFDQLQEFRKRGEHFALMVDEYGSLMGVVTLEDILEEIVGEITDEYDIDATAMRPQPDGSYLIEGKVTIRDLNRQFDWNLPDDNYSTLAGLILFESQSIPKIGQQFIFYDFRFEVLRRQRNQITLVRVIPSMINDKDSKQ